jgi:hypothetical protein
LPVPLKCRILLNKSDHIRPTYLIIIYSAKRGERITTLKDVPGIHIQGEMVLDPMLLWIIPPAPGLLLALLFAGAALLTTWSGGFEPTGNP